MCDLCKDAKKANAKDRTEYQKQWRNANPDKVSSYTKKWVAANPDKRFAAVSSWRKRNPEKVAAMNAKAGKKWASNNKGQRMASVRARQIAKKFRTPGWADLDKIAELYIEAERITKESGIPHEVDHFYPLQGKTVSGLHVPNNLRILTRTENRSKGSKICAA